MSVRIRIENCAPGEVIDLTLALSPRGRGSLLAEVDPNSPGIAIARTRTELAGLLKPSEMPRPERREDGSLGAEVWERLLPWAISEADSIGAFVLDQSGLAVAETSNLPLDRMEELTARLSIILHELVTLKLRGFDVGPPIFALGTLRLTMLHIPVTEDSWLALILVGEGIPNSDVQKEILEEVRLFVTGN